MESCCKQASSFCPAPKPLPGSEPAPAPSPPKDTHTVHSTSGVVDPIIRNPGVDKNHARILLHKEGSWASFCALVCMLGPCAVCELAADSRISHQC